MAEHARQADDLQRAFGQRQLEALGQAFQRFGLRGVVDGDLPQLAMARAVELARFAKACSCLAAPSMPPRFSPTRYSSRPARRDARR
jgi:hypothetical protein